MQAPPDHLPPTLPLVVRIGFAGSRLLWGGERHDEAILDTALLPALIERLRELPARLSLSPQHLLCGVSQAAIGADTLFARALQALALPHRVLLPQPLEAFLSASDADFTAVQRDATRALLQSPNVIEVRVASDANERRERFEATNLAILRESDVVVCLLRAGALPRAGGTHDLMQRAARANKPVLLLEVALIEGVPSLSPWQVPAAPGSAPFMPPGMPAELKGLELPPPTAERWPSAGSYIDAVRRFASAATRRHSAGFRRAALVIILLHIAATVLAAVASKGEVVAWVALLLAAELVLLGLGLMTHHALHHSLRVRHWARTRLLAETLRSMKSVSATAASLDYPLELALPDTFAPLLHTAAVLHALDQRQRGSAANAAADWAAQRAQYLDERLTGPQGQLRYFTEAARMSARRLHLAHAGFWLFSVAAFVATGLKLASVAGALPAPLAPLIATWGGLAAITLPVAAVGFLSWAAAGDLEARAATYAEMQTFLTRQVERLREADSLGDFARAVRETELGILGENLGWFSRRRFRGVA
jgi:hypothetical protein